MTRVATIPLQRTLASGIARSQENLATSQLQLNTGKKATDYAGLGLDAVRTLSARSMMAQQQAYKSNGGRVATTLSLYDASLNQIDTSLTDLSKQLLDAVGTGDAAGIQAAIDTAFGDLRTALNASEGGVPLFAGSQTSKLPFVPETVQDTVGLDAADAFTNDNVRQFTRIGEDMDLEHGIGASEVATNLIPAFRTLAEAAPFGEKLTDAQKQAITDAVSQLDVGLKDVRAVNATNGRNQNKVETLTDRADDRIDLFKKLIGSVEDADLGQVALDVTQRQTILEASYSVFAQLNSMSLANFLK